MATEENNCSNMMTQQWSQQVDANFPSAENTQGITSSFVYGTAENANLQTLQNSGQSLSNCDVLLGNLSDPGKSKSLQPNIPDSSVGMAFNPSDIKSRSAFQTANGCMAANTFALPQKQSLVSNSPAQFARRTNQVYLKPYTTVPTSHLDTVQYTRTNVIPPNDNSNASIATLDMAAKGFIRNGLYTLPNQFLNPNYFPRMPQYRQRNSPMPQYRQCNSPMPQYRQCSSPMPQDRQWNSPMPQYRQWNSPMPQLNKYQGALPSQHQAMAVVQPSPILHSTMQDTNSNLKTAVAKVSSTPPQQSTQNSYNFMQKDNAVSWPAQIAFSASRTIRPVVSVPKSYAPTGSPTNVVTPVMTNQRPVSRTRLLNVSPACSIPSNVQRPLAPRAVNSNKIQSSKSPMIVWLQPARPGIVQSEKRNLLPQQVAGSVPTTGTAIIEQNTRNYPPHVASSAVLQHIVPVSPVSSSGPRNSTPHSSAQPEDNKNFSHPGYNNNYSHEYACSEADKKFCRDFFFKLIMETEKMPNCSSNLKSLIQGLMDGTISLDHFTLALHKMFNLPMKAIPTIYLEKCLPFFRDSHFINELGLGGISPPPSHAQLLQVPMPILNQNDHFQSTIFQPATTERGLEKNSAASICQKKKVVSTIGDANDINDIVAMGGINLMEESENILATNSELVGLQTRFCKDDNFLLTDSFYARVASIAAKAGVQELGSNVVSLVAYAVQDKVKCLIEKASLVAEHRMEVLKNDSRYEVDQDVRSQIQFLKDVDRLEEKKRKEEELEFMRQLAKSRANSKDPKFMELRQKAKEMQLEEIEEKLLRETNLTALSAIGPRKKLKTESGAAGPNSVNGRNHSNSNMLMSKPREKRVSLRDLQFVMEQEKEPCFRSCLYKTYFK